LIPLLDNQNTLDLSSIFFIFFKIYEAIGILGLATDTYDSEGKIIATGPTKHITKEYISHIISKFTGDIMQVPPL
jgi:tRNA pseudouridine55 synthase